MCLPSDDLIVDAVISVICLSFYLCQPSEDWIVDAVISVICLSFYLCVNLRRIGLWML